MVNMHRVAPVNVAGPARGSVAVVVGVADPGQGIAVGDGNAEATVSLARPAQGQSGQAQYQGGDSACNQVHGVVLQVVLIDD